MSNLDWGKYIQKTKNRSFVNYLVEAVKILNLSNLTKGKVLDIGCGAGIDAKYLAENEFQVEAIDLNEDSIKQTRKICEGLTVNVIQKDLIDYDIAPDNYQLILVWNTLPFIIKDKASKVLIDIQDGLVRGGIFVFSIFGPEDDWAKIYSEMSFWTAEEFKKILSEMNFIKILEEKQKGPTASGEIKFWHKIQGIAQKK